MSKTIYVLETLALWTAAIMTIWAARDLRHQSLAGWFWLFGVLELAAAVVLTAYQTSVWGSVAKPYASTWLVAGIVLTLLADGWILSNA